MTDASVGVIKFLTVMGCTHEWPYAIYRTLLTDHRGALTLVISGKRWNRETWHRETRQRGTKVVSEHGWTK